MSETLKAAFGPDQAQRAAEALAVSLADDDLPAEEPALMRHLEDILATQRPDLSAYERSAVAFRTVRLLKPQASGSHAALDKPAPQARPTRRAPSETTARRPAKAPHPAPDEHAASTTGPSLRAQRLALGLSTIDIAARAGVPPHQIIQFEAGARTLPADVLARLTAALSGPEETSEEPPRASTDPSTPPDEPDAATLYALYRQLPKGCRRQIVALMKSMNAEL